LLKIGAEIEPYEIDQNSLRIIDSTNNTVVPSQYLTPEVVTFKEKAIYTTKADGCLAYFITSSENTMLLEKKNGTVWEMVHQIPMTSESVLETYLHPNTTYRALAEEKFAFVRTSLYDTNAGVSNTPDDQDGLDIGIDINGLSYSRNLYLFATREIVITAGPSAPGDINIMMWSGHWEPVDDFSMTAYDSRIITIPLQPGYANLYRIITSDAPVYAYGGDHTKENHNYFFIPANDTLGKVGKVFLHNTGQFTNDQTLKSIILEDNTTITVDEIFGGVFQPYVVKGPYNKGEIVSIPDYSNKLNYIEEHWGDGVNLAAWKSTTWSVANSGFTYMDGNFAVSNGGLTGTTLEFHKSYSQTINEAFVEIKMQWEQQGAKYKIYCSATGLNGSWIYLGGGHGGNNDLNAEPSPYISENVGLVDRTLWRFNITPIVGGMTATDPMKNIFINIVTEGDANPNNRVAVDDFKVTTTTFQGSTLGSSQGYRILSDKNIILWQETTPKTVYQYSTTSDLSKFTLANNDQFKWKSTVTLKNSSNYDYQDSPFLLKAEDFKNSGAVNLFNARDNSLRLVDSTGVLIPCIVNDGDVINSYIDDDDIIMITSNMPANTSENYTLYYDDVFDTPWWIPYGVTTDDSSDFFFIESNDLRIGL
ncbi:hypothetical protein KAJ27_05075, partial [bacterium]|nr:hypothetical protein [bacterium]